MKNLLNMLVTATTLNIYKHTAAAHDTLGSILLVTVNTIQHVLSDLNAFT